MKTAFIVGNGPSRKPIELEKLRPHGTIFGCNALYRDFIPDVLVAVDKRMVIELNENLVQFKTDCWTQPSKKYKKLEGFKYVFKPHQKIYQRWCSGSTALLIAINPDNYGSFDKIYLLGVDLDVDPWKSNIYLGTRNYKDCEKDAEHFSISLDKWEACFRDRPNIEFVRVVGDNYIIPDKWKKYKNLKHINVNEFKAEYCGS